MKFRFYSTMYLGLDGNSHCNTAELEFKNIEEATEWMKGGTIEQDDLGMAFIPLICEQIDDEDKE